jgi:threonine dehydratase
VHSRYAIDVDDVRAAAKRIAGSAHVTPVMTCDTMDRLASAAARESRGEAADAAADPELALFFKCENLQKIGAFKFRGATNAVRKALEKNGGDKRLVVVTHSSGNHAQALALAAKQAGIRSVIVMPENAPQVKVDGVRGYGGEVVFCASTQAARELAANEQVTKHAPHSLLVPPYDFGDVMAGQGTLALELLEQAPNLDALIVPVGGGGMLSGVCIAAKAVNPHIRIYAAEPRMADDTFQSITHSERIPLPAPSSTVADGLRTSLGDLTYPVIRDQVSGVIRVEEDEIVRAMKLVFERMKLVIEPSAGVSVAAALSKQFYNTRDSGPLSRDNNPDVVGMEGAREHKVVRIGIVLCGGNVDLDRLPWVKA